MNDVEIAHLPGKDNTAADALSRLACPMIAQSAAEDDWLAAYKADPKITRIYFDAHGNLTLPHAFHHHRIWDADRILVPRSKIREVLEQCHSTVLHGHWGPRKTFDLVARKYFFPHAKTLVQEFVRACFTCQRIKPGRRGEQGL